MLEVVNVVLLMKEREQFPGTVEAELQRQELQVQAQHGLPVAYNGPFQGTPMVV